MPRNTLNSISRSSTIPPEDNLEVPTFEEIPEEPLHIPNNPPQLPDIPEIPEHPDNPPDEISHHSHHSHHSRRDLEDEPTPNLAEAILLMTNELRRRETAPRSASGKVKEPDTFDGSDPRKLNNFMLLCNLYFRNNPAYSDDEPKVTFALSHLRGT